jgi:hypothetical protein
MRVLHPEQYVLAQLSAPSIFAQIVRRHVRAPLPIITDPRRL